MNKACIIVATATTLVFAGCANRGADDRIEADIERTELGGPGYAVVAWRQVDRARLAGNVVIITSGEEPVFVQQAAYHHVPVEGRGEAAANTKELLKRLQAVEQQLREQQTPSEAAPSPASEPTSAPEPAPVQPVTPPVEAPASAPAAQPTSALSPAPKPTKTELRVIEGDTIQTRNGPVPVRHIVSATVEDRGEAKP